MKLNKILLIIFMLIVLSNFIAAIGICELNNEEYHIGELSTFVCYCTTPQETNREGYIVFTNDNGTILQSVQTTE